MSGTYVLLKLQAILVMQLLASHFLEKLHNISESNSGLFAETWSSNLIDSIGTNELLSAELNDIETEVEFPSSNLGQSLETVAKVMSTKDARGVDVDTFYVQLGGMKFLFLDEYYCGCIVFNT